MRKSYGIISLKAQDLETEGLRGTNNAVDWVQKRAGDWFFPLLLTQKICGSPLQPTDLQHNLKNNSLPQRNIRINLPFPFEFSAIHLMWGCVLEAGNWKAWWSRNLRAHPSLIHMGTLFVCKWPLILLWIARLMVFSGGQSVIPRILTRLSRSLTRRVFRTFAQKPDSGRDHRWGVVGKSLTLTHTQTHSSI